MTERIYCSQLNPEETICGTVDVVDVWLLLEYRAVFGKKATTENALSPDVSNWLDETVANFAKAGLKARVQFIRQPETDREGVSYFVVSQGQTFLVEVPDYQQLLTINSEEVLGGKTPAKRIEAAHYFVCTNGQRDLCCAKFGLPVYLELRQRFSERVWQTSHVGGHRFAPNVLVIPQGALYGRVHPESIDSFCNIIESGRVAFDQLRGRSCYPKHVQAAEAFVGVDNLRLLHVVETEDDYQVQFAGRDSKYVVELARSDQYSVQASCSAEPKSVECWLGDVSQTSPA